MIMILATFARLKLSPNLMIMIIDVEGHSAGLTIAPGWFVGYLVGDWVGDRVWHGSGVKV